MFNAVPTSFARSVVGMTGAAIFGTACLLAATGPAQAAEAPRTVAVGTAGLDLASPAGRAALDARVVRAARQVCDTGMDDLAAKAAERACVIAARDHAKAQVIAILNPVREYADASSTPGSAAR